MLALENVLRLTAVMFMTGFHMQYIFIFSYIALLVFCNRSVLSLYLYPFIATLIELSTGTSCVSIISISFKSGHINIWMFHIFEDSSRYQLC